MRAKTKTDQRSAYDSLVDEINELGAGYGGAARTLHSVLTLTEDEAARAA